MSLRQIEEALLKLNYDFARFDLQHFLDHIERLQRRPILTIAAKFKEEQLSAVWVKAETAHYIFYNQSYHPVHITHSILHEIAHLILDHPCHGLDEVLAPEMIAELKLHNPVGHSRKVSPSFMSKPEEQEAEAFVFLIQQRVKKAHRFYELMGKGSSIEALNRHVSSMGFEV